jgi:hypothetical protein
VYTDYRISNLVIIYQRRLSPVPTPGVVSSLTVTQLGGTVMVNGTTYTQKEPALPPLETGTQALFLLQHVADKYFISGKYFGAFGIVEGRLIPLMQREDFAEDYRNMPVSAAIRSMTAILQSKGASPRILNAHSRGS